MSEIREGWMPAPLPAPLALPMQELLGRMLGESRERVIRDVMIVGAAPGVGTTFVSHRWAAQLAPAFGSVLSIEVKPGATGPVAQEEVDTAFSVGGAVVAITMPEHALLGLIARGGALVPPDWRDRFGLIVWDVPPPTVSPVATAMAHGVDAIVLVVQAHRTRRPVAQHAATRLQESGGRLLGVVLNRTLDFIPGWLYRRL